MSPPSPRNPAFTVLVPTYRRAELLPRALASVLAQTFEDFELLVVDDASPDDTARVVAATRDPRLRYVRRDENGGAAATRNTGIRQARGRWIAFLDDDDELLPAFLEKTHEVVGRSPRQVGATWCGVLWVEETPEGRRELREELWQPRYESREAAYLGFLQSRRIGTNCGLTVRRSVFDTVGLFDEELRCGEDTDFLVRLVQNFDFRVVPQTLVVLHLHPGPQLRAVSSANAQAYRHLIAKHRPALEAHPRLWAALHYKAGWLHYHAGDRRGGRSHLLRGLGRRPWHWKSLGALVLFETLGARGAVVHRALSTLRSRRRSLSVEAP